MWQFNKRASALEFLTSSTISCTTLFAFEKEMKHYWDTDTVMKSFFDIDLESIDPNSIGDLMLIFEIQINPNYSHKFKCRTIQELDRPFEIFFLC